jgi:hypothetical protein
MKLWHLIRGNNESFEMTESFGFLNECQIKLDLELCLHFLSVFSVVINECVLCIHGGLKPLMLLIDEIRAIEDGEKRSRREKSRLRGLCR